MEGLVVKMTREALELLDPYEGVPEWYGRYPLELHVWGLDGAEGPTVVQAQAYVQQEHKFFKHPSDEYLTLCCRTVYKSR